MLKILIIGQGLAGSLVAHELINRGHDVTVVNHHNPSSASHVAAGLINPITGIKLAPSFEFERFFDTAKQTYTQLASTYHQTFFINKPVRRLITNKDELAWWEKRKETPFFQKHTQFFDQSLPFFKNPMPSIVFPHAGFVNISQLLACLTQKFSKNATLIKENVNYNDLKVDQSYVEWKNKSYDYAIFCEGTQVLENPWFNHLPFNFSKGEILTVKVSGSKQLPDEILNCGKWLLPLDNQTFKAGATYHWDNFDTQPTEQARLEILNTLNQFLDVDFEVIDHVAGVRPTTKDYKPFLGRHHTYSNLFILNGLGSKGAVMVPYLAKQLVDNLENDESIWQEVNINRF